MNIIVTGGLGYIGSHTVVELLERGHEVFVIDNLYNAKRSVKERIEGITGRSIRFEEADCADEQAMDAIFSSYSADCVIHFAGYKAVGESVQKPLAYYRNNLDSTLTLLEMMKKYQVPTLVFSSSATVYAPTNPCPLREEMPREATNPYGRTKVQIEEILEDVVRAGDIERAVCLRYFNPIGAHPSGQIGESPVGIPNNLMPYICQVADGTRKELHVFGNDYDTPDGTGVRDYIHVQDLAVGHALAIEKVEKAGFYAYNLGTGAGTGVLELVHAFEEATGVEIPYVIDERRAGDVARLIANCDRAREELGFTAERTVQEACASAWNYQKNEPSFS